MCVTCIGVRSRECYTPFRAACSHAGVGSIVLGLRSRSRVLPPSACFVVKATKFPLLTYLGVWGVGSPQSHWAVLGSTIRYGMVRYGMLRAPYCALSYCTVLHCTVSYGTYRAVLYCTVLYCAVWCCTALPPTRHSRPTAEPHVPAQPYNQTRPRLGRRGEIGGERTVKAGAKWTGVLLESSRAHGVTTVSLSFSRSWVRLRASSPRNTEARLAEGRSL